MIDRSKPLPIHEGRNLIEEVARLEAAHDNEFMQMGQYVDILLATAPAMLDALCEIRAGDSEKLDLLMYQIRTSTDLPIDMKIGFDWIIEVLRRYRDMARQMEANR